MTNSVPTISKAVIAKRKNKFDYHLDSGGFKMFEGLLFFISAGIVCELAAINRNGRKNIKQQAELIQILKENLYKDIK